MHFSSVAFKRHHTFDTGKSIQIPISFQISSPWALQSGCHTNWNNSNRRNVWMWETAHAVPAHTFLFLSVSCPVIVNLVYFYSWRYIVIALQWGEWQRVLWGFHSYTPRPCKPRFKRIYRSHHTAGWLVGRLVYVIVSTHCRQIAMKPGMPKHRQL